jgi:hypothetical protein
METNLAPVEEVPRLARSGQITGGPSAQAPFGVNRS